MDTRVLIVGGIRLYREGLEHILTEVEQIALVGTASCREEAVRRVNAVNPDVALLDIAMSEALVTVREITQLAPDLKVVALAVPDIDSEVIACAEAGVAGYVTRDGSLSDVIQSIEAAAKGELQCSARIAGSLLRRVSALAVERYKGADGARLTNRESAILELVDQGLSNKEIARRLSIEVATVRTHVHNILDKLGVHRRGEAAALVRRSHFLRANTDNRSTTQSTQLAHKTTERI